MNIWDTIKALLGTKTTWFAIAKWVITGLGAMSVLSATQAAGLTDAVQTLIDVVVYIGALFGFASGSSDIAKRHALLKVQNGTLK